MALFEASILSDPLSLSTPVVDPQNIRAYSSQLKSLFCALTFSQAAGKFLHKSFYGSAEEQKS